MCGSCLDNRGASSPEEEEEEEESTKKRSVKLYHGFQTEKALSPRGEREFVMSWAAQLRSVGGFKAAEPACSAEELLSFTSRPLQNSDHSVELQSRSDLQRTLMQTMRVNVKESGGLAQPLFYSS